MEESKIKVWVYLNSQDNTSVVGTYMLMDDCYEDRDFGIIIVGNVFNLKKRYVQYEAEVVEDDNGDFYLAQDRAHLTTLPKLFYGQKPECTKLIGYGKCWRTSDSTKNTFVTVNCQGITFEDSPLRCSIKLTNNMVPSIEKYASFIDAQGEDIRYTYGEICNALERVKDIVDFKGFEVDDEPKFSFLIEKGLVLSWRGYDFHNWIEFVNTDGTISKDVLEKETLKIKQTRKRKDNSVENVSTRLEYNEKILELIKDEVSDDTYTLLAEKVHEFPQQRFGQLIVNYLYISNTVEKEVQKIFPSYPQRDPFFEESSETCERLLKKSKN